MTVRHERAAVFILLAASSILFSLYGLVTPLFEASDELWHYPLVQHLATTASLPIQRSDQTDSDAPWRQEGSQPPLYYALAALVTAPFDSSNWRDLRRLNPHSDMGVPTRDGNANAVLHTPAESFPWTRAALAVHIARLLSVVMSTLTVCFAYRIGQELFPRLDKQGGTGNLVASLNGATPLPLVVTTASPRDLNAKLRLGTMIFTAGIPMFAFISGSVNNDNAAVLFATIGVWWALRMVRSGNASVRSAIIAGLFTSAAILSKSSTAGSVAVFGISFVLAGYRQKTQTAGMSTGSGRARSFGANVLASAAGFSIVVLACTGWWFIRNQMLYGDLLGWNSFLDAVGRRVPPASLAQLWSEREGFVWAFWGVFGTLNIILPSEVYGVLDLMALIALAGGLWAVFRTTSGWRSRVITMRRPSGIHVFSSAILNHSSLIICVSWVAITFIALLRWTSLTPASQGRLMFPCIAVIAAAITYGLTRFHRAVLLVSSAGISVLAFAVPVAIIAPTYARPPALVQATPAHHFGSAPGAASDTTSVVTFGNALDLIGYDDYPITVYPGDQPMLRLYWHLRTHVSVNYSVFVHLVDENNVIVAQRDMYPGQGSLATSELLAGYTWRDLYAPRIPYTALAPQRLHWAVGLYDLQTGARLAITSDHDANQSDQAVQFGQLDLLHGKDADTALLHYQEGMDLTGYELAPRSPDAHTPFTVTFAWRTERKPGTDYTISLQLLDDKADKIAQQDSAPAGGNAPTASWTAGTTITDTHVLQIAPDALPGVYRLLLVWYVPADFTKLGAYDGHTGQYVGNEVELTRIRVQ